MRYHLVLDKDRGAAEIHAEDCPPVGSLLDIRSAIDECQAWLARHPDSAQARMASDPDKRDYIRRRLSFHRCCSSTPARRSRQRDVSLQVPARPRSGAFGLLVFCSLCLSARQADGRHSAARCLPHIAPPEARVDDPPPAATRWPLVSQAGQVERNHGRRRRTRGSRS